MDHDDHITALLHAVPEIEYEYRHANTATTGNLQPEKLLLIAVMEDALDALDGRVTAGTYTPSKFSGKNVMLVVRQREKSKREARRWFASNDDWGLFSFLSVCGWLEWDPEWVRKAVRNRPRKTAAGIA